MVLTNYYQAEAAVNKVIISRIIVNI